MRLNHEMDMGIYTKIQDKKIHSGLRSFDYKALLGALFTEEKNKKNVNINDRKCHLCRNKDESITHLFVECEKIVNSMAKSNINYLTFEKIIHMEKLNLKDKQYLSLFKLQFGSYETQ